ncbi:peroxide stress protein YaaA [Melaminivora sp.]|uniref:peroxide stress protein YaaA n=1 Tax=Melaminivora sp. TaxID=1933032 RepID=UPI0028B04DE6|nr:peroxide stress protein YaaA [Melaminivora sp.]
MLFLLSPAKSLDYGRPLPTGLAHSVPHFEREAAQLAAVLRAKAPQELAQLMALSDKLAALNVARYAAWQPTSAPQHARQALLAFNGDVYEGLDASSLDLQDLDWAQEHLAILSGIYGVLRPLDLMQPYRLEMGTRLATDAGASLYAFWGTRIAEHLNARLAQAAEPVVVNLASQEYFKSVARPALQARVVECVFEDWRAGQYKVISFHAKRARGLMARWAIQARASQPRQLQSFAAEGYSWAPGVSTPERLVFRRKPA